MGNKSGINYSRGSVFIPGLKRIFLSFVQPYHPIFLDEWHVIRNIDRFLDVNVCILIQSPVLTDPYQLSLLIN